MALYLGRWKIGHGIQLVAVFYDGSLDAEIQGHSETRPTNIKRVISFDTGLLYETAVLLTTKKLVLPADTNHSCYQIWEDPRVSR